MNGLRKTGSSKSFVKTKLTLFSLYFQKRCWLKSAGKAYLASALHLSLDPYNLQLHCFLRLGALLC